MLESVGWVGTTAGHSAVLDTITASGFSVRTVGDRLEGLAECDLVIHVGAGPTEASRGELRAVESHLTSGAILVSIAPGEELARLTDGLRRPEQFLALQFGGADQANPRVEVATTEQTAPGVVQATLQFVRRLSRTPVLISSPVTRPADSQGGSRERPAAPRRRRASESL